MALLPVFFSTTVRKLGHPLASVSCSCLCKVTPSRAVSRWPTANSNVSLIKSSQLSSHLISVFSNSLPLLTITWKHCKVLVVHIKWPFRNRWTIMFALPCWSLEIHNPWQFNLLIYVMLELEKFNFLMMVFFICDRFYIMFLMTVHLNRCFYHVGFIEANDKMLGERQISLHNQQHF